MPCCRASTTRKFGRRPSPPLSVLYLRVETLCFAILQTPYYTANADNPPRYRPYHWMPAACTTGRRRTFLPVPGLHPPTIRPKPPHHHHIRLHVCLMYHPPGNYPTSMAVR